MSTVTNIRAGVEPSLQAVSERGWRRGFANLLRNETHAWWGTRKWLVHLLLCGQLADQAALHGVLVKIRDLGLPLVAVTTLGAEEAEPRAS